MKAALGLIARSDLACRVLLPMLREIQRQRSEQRRAAVEDAVARFFPELTVRHGPFRGLTYPTARSFGSVLFPKLLGSYESELHPAVEEALAQEPSAIVDIGCAEGYYAIGLALRCPGATVFAFDIDSGARDACLAMARGNGVQDRVQMFEHCSSEQLAALPLGAGALIISDCEGAERWLFDEPTLAALGAHNLLIETHDFVHPGTRDLLRARLAPTHDVSEIPSLDEDSKASRFQVQEVSGLPASRRRQLLAENRPASMSWLWCRSRSA